MVRTVDTGRALLERARAERAHPARRVRYERFGAIVQTVVPRALVFVDRAYATRVLGAKDLPLWRGDEPGVGEVVLSAPLEAHLQLTNRCTAPPASALYQGP